MADDRHTRGQAISLATDDQNIRERMSNESGCNWQSPTSNRPIWGLYNDVEVMKYRPCIISSDHVLQCSHRVFADIKKTRRLSDKF